MQISLQSAEVWRQYQVNAARLDRILVAVVNGEVVGNLGLLPATHVRRAHVAGIGLALRDDWHGYGLAL